MLLVAGLLVGYFVNALVNVLVSGADAESLQVYVSWGLGSFGRLTLDGIWVFALVVLAIMFATQLVDNFVYQPLIYSTSIKASPLEIFIVILLAGHIGGVVGMLVAIPTYTVIRVIASRFFPDLKVVKRLIPDLAKEVRNQEENEFLKD